MTLSVPSLLAAAISLLIPPPAATALTVDQSVPPLELDEELPEHPAASSARAPSPASAIRYGDLTRMPPVNFPSHRVRPRGRGKAMSGGRQTVPVSAIRPKCL